MLDITRAAPADFEQIRAFYHHLIDGMQTAQYRPGWKKDIYPSNEDLQEALEAGSLYTGRLDGAIVAAMVVNQVNNEGYSQISWPVQASDKEISVIHILGVCPAHSGRGFAKAMVRHAISLARAQSHKAVRLDVLAGNLPAERLYASLGFQYVDTVPMFYEDTGRTRFLLYEYPL